MKECCEELRPGVRVLLGPGPSNVHPRVLRATATPLVGHLDPDFLLIMDDIKELLKYVFQTANDLTIPISGTGSAGMETALCNMIEPDDEVIVCVSGLFGERMCDIVQRCGGILRRIDAEWGSIIEPEQLREVMKHHRAKLVAIVHAETSTGVLQPLDEISRIAHEHGSLLLVDLVTSVGGHPVDVDRIGIDICYGASQKCLSCPPGLAPITLNDRARDLLHNRRSKVQSWYLDLTMVERYWGKDRTYHHTAPITMNYALREALRLVFEETLEACFKRHQRNHKALVAGLEAMGLEMLVRREHRLWTLNAVRIPSSISDTRVRGRLLSEFGIEIGAGLGRLKGHIWRIGLMGHSSSRRNVVLFLGALEQILSEEGYHLSPGQALAAAGEVYREADEDH